LDSDDYKCIKVKADKSILKEKYKLIKGMHFGTYALTFLIAVVEIVWLLGDPMFSLIPGWHQFQFFNEKYKSDYYISRTTLLIGVVIILCFLPKNTKVIKKGLRCQYGAGDEVPTIINWNESMETIPFNVLYLIGGGFALVSGIEKSYLAEGIVKGFETFVFIIPGMAPIISVLLVSIFSEFIPGPPLRSLIVKIFTSMCIHNKFNPLFVCFPISVAVSFAFVWPFASPSVAILFETCSVKKSDLTSTGIMVKLICVSTLMIVVYTLGAFLFDFFGNPSWTKYYRDIDYYP